MELFKEKYGQKVNMADCPSYLSKLIKQRIPIITWLPQYTVIDATSDFIAGITLGLTIVPQSIAYASLAGLTPEIGLNSAFAGGFIYALLGTIKQVSIGPTSLMSLITLEYTKDIPQEYLYQYVFLLTFLCGCVELIMGTLKLGFLVNLISAPVISGFTTASALIIIASQLKEILGIRFKSHDFRENIINLIKYSGNTRWQNTLLGIFCIVFLLSLRKLKDVKVKNEKYGKSIEKILWFVSTSRNAIVVILSCVLTYFIEGFCQESRMVTNCPPFILTKNVTAGLPRIAHPAFGMQQGNTTVSFMEMVNTLSSAIFVIPIVAVLINVSIAKTFTTGGTIDATQEMFSLSLCNIMASFLSSMPICGAFTRSAVSNASGVRTPLSNIYSVMVTILALTYITPYFHYIPTATLAAVLIAAVVFLIDVQIVMPLWRCCKRDLGITAVTMVACLYYGVEIGLLTGVICNLIHLIYLWARPSVTIDRCKNEYGEYLLVTPDLGFFFPAVDHLYTTISKAMKKNVKPYPVAVNCCYFRGIDYSAMKGLSMIAEDFKKRGQKLVLFNVTDHIINSYNKSGCSNIQFCAFNENLDDFLFDDSICLRNCATYPMITINGVSNDPEEVHKPEDKKDESEQGLLLRSTDHATQISVVLN